MTLIETTIETFAARLTKVGEAMDLVIAAKDENVRPAVEALAEQLIAFLDATAPDPDVEEEPEGDGYADDEPSLGASDGANQERTWSLQQNSTDDREEQNEDGDELDKLEASDLEICGESDTDRMGSTTVDDEPSLGSLDGRMSQNVGGCLIVAAFGKWAGIANSIPLSRKAELRISPTTRLIPGRPLSGAPALYRKLG